MEDQTEDISKEQVDAGRGVVKGTNTDSDKNTTVNQEDECERPDERARKAGY